MLTDPDVGHYPEFAAFLVATFDLMDKQLEAPGLLDVDGRVYELIFIGRSGRPFPVGVEIAALAPGLEPLDTSQTDQDLWAILEWLVAGVGKPWSVEDLRTTGRIYRVIPTDS
ncbi:MAG TPA: hypothetical protein DCL97_01320 [Dehalococcoidia bacterium]|nr:hypothetical protein [Dehalococcoidia bacterium]